MLDRNPSQHHIIPRSRKGQGDKGNLALIVNKNHRNYHTLFANKTPEEIIDMLVYYFWKSQDGRNGTRFILKWLKHNT